MGVMIFLSDIMIPLLIFGIVGYGILNRQNIYEEFIDGAKDGFQTVIGIMPTLIGLMVAVGILRASGFLECFPGCWDGDRLAGFSAGADTGHGGQNVLVLCGDRTSFRYLQRVRRGFHAGKDGIHHDEQHGDDLLYDVGLFYGGGDQKKPLHAGGRADRNHCGNRRKHYSGGIYVSSRRLWLRPGRIFSAKCL